jgi:hypothetical protein
MNELEPDVGAEFWEKEGNWCELLDMLPFAEDGVDGVELLAVDVPFGGGGGRPKNDPFDNVPVNSGREKKLPPEEAPFVWLPLPLLLPLPFAAALLLVVLAEEDRGRMEGIRSGGGSSLVEWVCRNMGVSRCSRLRWMEVCAGVGCRMFNAMAAGAAGAGVVIIDYQWWLQTLQYLLYDTV